MSEEQPTWAPAADSLRRITGRLRATPSEPARGQIWRARWNDATQLVALVATNDELDWVDAVALSPETVIDETTVPLRATATDLPFDVVAWPESLHRLPIRVLDVQLGEIDEPDVAAIEQPGGDGARIRSALDERSQVRAELYDTMDRLSAASWAPAATEPFDYDAALTAVSLTVSGLADAAGLEPGDITDLLRGDVASPSVAEAIAPLLDTDPAALLGAGSVSDDVVWVLDRPDLRARLRNRGLHEGFDDEGQWRLQVAVGGYLPVAARTTGHNDERRRIRGLVEDFLDET